MTVEQRFFIRILSDHIHDKCSMPGKCELDWKKVADYADEQALSGLVYIQLVIFSKSIQIWHRILSCDYKRGFIPIYTSMPTGVQS